MRPVRCVYGVVILAGASLGRDELLTREEDNLGSAGRGFRHVGQEKEFTVRDRSNPTPQATRQRVRKPTNTPPTDGAGKWRSVPNPVSVSKEL